MAAKGLALPVRTPSHLQGGGEREGEGSVADIIHTIEGWLIESLATFGVEGERDERMQGVYSFT